MLYRKHHVMEKCKRLSQVRVEVHSTLSAQKESFLLFGLLVHSCFLHVDYVNRKEHAYCFVNFLLNIVL